MKRSALLLCLLGLASCVSESTSTNDSPGSFPGAGTIFLLESSGGIVLKTDSMTVLSTDATFSGKTGVIALGKPNGDTLGYFYYDKSGDILQGTKHGWKTYPTGSKGEIVVIDTLSQPGVRNTSSVKYVGQENITIDGTTYLTEVTRSTDESIFENSFARKVERDWFCPQLRMFLRHDYTDSSGTLQQFTSGAAGEMHVTKVIRK